jgi:hypothetical protein
MLQKISAAIMARQSTMTAASGKGRSAIGTNPSRGNWKLSSGWSTATNISEPGEGQSGVPRNCRPGRQTRRFRACRAWQTFCALWLYRSWSIIAKPFVGDDALHGVIRTDHGTMSALARKFFIARQLVNGEPNVWPVVDPRRRSPHSVVVGRIFLRGM